MVRVRKKMITKDNAGWMEKTIRRGRHGRAQDFPGKVWTKKRGPEGKGRRLIKDECGVILWGGWGGGVLGCGEFCGVRQKNSKEQCSSKEKKKTGREKGRAIPEYMDCLGMLNGPDWRVQEP